MDERTLWFASGWLVGRDEGDEVRLDFQFQFIADDAEQAWKNIPALARDGLPDAGDYRVETTDFRRVGLVYITEPTGQ